MLRISLNYFYRLQCSKLIANSTRKTCHIIQLRCLSTWSNYHNFQFNHNYNSRNFQLLSILHCSFHPINLNSSHSKYLKEVDNLSNLILSEISEKFEDEQVEELNKILAFLLTKGYASKDIRKRCLPYLKSCNFSIAKFKQLDDLYSDILLLVPLLSLQLTLLKLASKQAKNDKLAIKGFSNRITYLSHHLELQPVELIPALTKHSALLTMKFQRLNYKMNLLKNANISSKYIVKDLWIFNYNERLLASRVQAALKNQMELKPWMLRCSEKFFVSLLTKRAETQRILDGESVVNYLAKNLNCATEYVEYMMERNKLLKAINIPKLEQIINFLFEKGYTPQEIRLFPRVFCSSLQTLSKRFDEYQQLKRTLPTISQLCISSKRYKTKLEEKQ